MINDAPPLLYDLGAFPDGEMHRFVAFLEHLSTSRSSFIRGEAQRYLERFRPIAQSEKTRPPRTAAEFAAVVRAEEAFHLLTIEYNVSAAKAYVAATKTHPKVLNPKQYLATNGGFIRIDTERAMSDAIDLSWPVIGAKLPGDAGWCIIDGWSRIYKAAHTDVDFLEVHWLDAEESEAFRLH